MKIARVEDAWKIDGRQALNCVLFSAFRSKEEHTKAFSKNLELVFPNNSLVRVKLLDLDIVPTFSGGFQALVGVELPSGINEVPAGTIIRSITSN